MLLGGSWSSPNWNWGYGQGTGHDCALLCRQRYRTRKDRKELLDMLWEPMDLKKEEDISTEARQPPFEEVKLVLGLAWQNGRRDGSDGGIGGYGDVLKNMAACRYEGEDEESNAIHLVADMKERFHLIASDASAGKMKEIDRLSNTDVDLMRRKCASLVLSEMGFVNNGL